MKLTSSRPVFEWSGRLDVSFMNEVSWPGSRR
jgi:hypothetical protein